MQGVYDKANEMRANGEFTENIALNGAAAEASGTVKNAGDSVKQEDVEVL